MISSNPTSLYLHIPFCKSKCIYCDFFSRGEKKAKWNKFIEAVLEEARRRSHELSISPDTLYIGGGTPSLMPTDILKRLVHGIKEIFHVNYFREFTLEINPDDVDETKCYHWKEVGVNRASMGIQSFNDEELSIIGRRHNSDRGRQAIRILKEFFNNVSIDLIFGIPKQTAESWSATINEAISLNPQHISCYTLMLEEKTPLTILYEKGRISLPSEDEIINMWKVLKEKTLKTGYEQYEISNFSLPSFQSLHNSRYWSGNPYLGLGPSAHSYDGYALRRANPNNIDEYIRHFSTISDEKAAKTFFIEEELSEKERMEEFVMLALRTSKGIDLEEFRIKFGDTHVHKLKKKALSLVSHNDLKIMDNHISLTQTSIMVADRIILELLP